MPTFVMRKGKLVDKRIASPLYDASAAPQVISDEMPMTRHMANNNWYSSKSKFREATKAAGCIEVGNETSTLLKDRGHGTMPTREQRRVEIRNEIRRRLHSG